MAGKNICSKRLSISKADILRSSRTEILSGPPAHAAGSDCTNRQPPDEIKLEEKDFKTVSDTLPSPDTDCFASVDTSLVEGHRLGRYRIISKCGGGNMGVVYKAQDLVLNRIVALKVLKRMESMVRFWQEVRAIAALRHPNIVTLYDVVKEDVRSYFAMEYVDACPWKNLAHARMALS